MLSVTHNGAISCTVNQDNMLYSVGKEDSSMDVSSFICSFCLAIALNDPLHCSLIYHNYRNLIMAKVTRKKGRRKRTLTEQLWAVMAILLAVAMVLTTVISLFGTGAHGG